MQNVIVSKANIGSQEVNSVNARDLWSALEVETPFDKWINRRISEIGAIENEEFSTFLSKTPNGGRPLKEYIVNIDLAKEISMLERTDKGREIRRYFIEVEKEYMKAKKPMTLLETARELVLSLEREQELKEKVNLLTHTSKLYTSTEIAKELGFKSARAFNEKLNEDKIHYRVNGTWLLYAKYSEMKLTSIKQHILENGKIIYDRKWTGLGRDFLIERYRKE